MRESPSSEKRKLTAKRSPVLLFRTLKESEYGALDKAARFEEKPRLARPQSFHISELLRIGLRPLARPGRYA